MKYYAVRSGRTPGIYTTWSDCEKQVKGCPGAIFKSFSSLEEAENFINKAPADNDIHDQSEVTDDVPYAFVDGSFNGATKLYGCGGYLYENGTYHLIIASGSGPESQMRNVAGEIQGSCKAIELAYQLNLPKIRIYYDYSGIEHWATGTWKCKNDWTKNYQAFVQKYLAKGLEIEFIHTKGHTGITGNELVDRLAKYAVGITDAKIVKDIDKFSKELGIEDWKDVLT